MTCEEAGWYARIYIKFWCRNFDTPTPIQSLETPSLKNLKNPTFPYPSDRGSDSTLSGVATEAFHAQESKTASKAASPICTFRFDMLVSSALFNSLPLTGSPVVRLKGHQQRSIDEFFPCIVLMGSTWWEKKGRFRFRVAYSILIFSNWQSNQNFFWFQNGNNINERYGFTSKEKERIGEWWALESII